MGGQNENFQERHSGAARRGGTEDPGAGLGVIISSNSAQLLPGLAPRARPLESATSSDWLKLGSRKAAPS